jgi:hypothetical protein
MMLDNVLLPATTYAVPVPGTRTYYYQVRPVRTCTKPPCQL